MLHGKRCGETSPSFSVPSPVDAMRVTLTINGPHFISATKFVSIFILGGGMDVYKKSGIRM